ncbi:MAG: exonuclease domain-containing protein, partial [Clostridia bacterium]|nr:exonuclease domain-containing protein [Clostridia bacterium]
MHYIILDMEWDSAYNKRLSRFINQILQIGAVKLDDNFNIVDTFERNVRSSFSNRVSGRFASLTGITNEIMRNGIPFDTAVDDYNSFVGDDTVTMTWSKSDLYTIAENEKNLLDNKKFKIEKYLDLQVFIQNEMRLLGFECNSQISLSNAAQMLGVNAENYDLHTAKDDSLLAAQLLKKYYNKERFEPLIRDTSNPEFYERLTFKPYYIGDMNSEYVNKEDFNFNCENCNVAVNKVSKWHFKNRNFTAIHVCPVCNKKYVARVSVKKTYDSVTVKKKLSDY